MITFDQLGTGRSQSPPPDYAWSVARAAADVDAVRAHFDVERVDVLGHSWGGMLALQYALDFPERVHRLVLANTASSTGSVTAAFARQLAELLTPQAAGAALNADACLDHAAPAFTDAARSWFERYFVGGRSEQAESLVSEALEPDAGALGLWGRRLWLADAAIREWSAEPRLGEIASPTLVIHGGRDTSDFHVNQVLAAGIPDCEWITLQRGGHMMINDPNFSVYLTIVDDFLNGWKHPGGGA